MVQSPETKKELKSLCRQETQILFTKMSLIRLVFNMIWLIAKKKDLTKRTQSDKVLRDKVFKIARYPKYYGYQRGLASIFLIRNLVEVMLTLSQIISLRVNIISRLLENLRDEKFIHLSEAIFGALFS